MKMQAFKGDKVCIAQFANRPAKPLLLGTRIILGIKPKGEFRINPQAQGHLLSGSILKSRSQRMIKHQVVGKLANFLQLS